MSKYKNKKVKTPEGVFDSEVEYAYWLSLKKKQEAGEIEHLSRQSKFELIPHQKINGKVVERACYYIADFFYKKDGELVVVDVKSEYTRKLPEYRIKKKLMLYVYGIQIQEIVLKHGRKRLDLPS